MEIEPDASEARISSVGGGGGGGGGGGDTQTAAVVTKLARRPPPAIVLPARWRAWSIASQSDAAAEVMSASNCGESLPCAD